MIVSSPWTRTPWRISYFQAERPARPKVRQPLQSHPCVVSLVLIASMSLGVMVSHKNLMSSAMQDFVVGELNNAVAPVSPPPP